MPFLVPQRSKGNTGISFFHEFNHQAFGCVMGQKHCLCLCPPLRLRGRTGVFRGREGYLLAARPRALPSASKGPLSLLRFLCGYFFRAVGRVFPTAAKEQFGSPYFCRLAGFWDGRMCFPGRDCVSLHCLLTQGCS